LGAYNKIGAYNTRVPNFFQMLVRKVNKQVELADLSFLTNDMSKQNVCGN